MTFKLAHLSDAHIGPLPKPLRRELVGKRLTGYLNWHRGRHSAHDMDVLAALVMDMHAHAPDHVAMTGDILNIGLHAEFPLARAWLETLGKPGDVSFTPGNHDAYVRSTLVQLAHTFGPFSSSDGASPQAEAHFPFMRVRGQVAIIGLSSAIPTAPFIASGKLGTTQLRELAGLLDKAKAQDLARVVLLHHPPHRAGAKAARGLRDARAFESVIVNHGADLILHGHNHTTSSYRIACRDGSEAIVSGVPSCSLVRGLTRATWHLFSIARNKGETTIEARARGLLPGTTEIGDLGPVNLKLERASVVAESLRWPRLK